MKPAINPDQFEQFQQLMKLGTAHGCTEQALVIMRLLRDAVEPTLEMTVFAAWQLISAGQFQEARQMLEAAAQSHPEHHEFKALLATALFFSEDPLWHSYAFEVEQSPEPDEAAVGVVGRLKAAADTGLSVSYLHRLMLRPAPVPARAEPEVAELH